MDFLEVGGWFLENRMEDEWKWKKKETIYKYENNKKQMISNIHIK